MMIPIDKMSTTDKVIESIRSYIQEPGRNPGEKLPTENELGKQLGVGRSSIREALRVLQTMGYVTIVHGKGAFIKACQPSSEEAERWFEGNIFALRDIYMVREALEPLVAREAARHITEEALAELRQIVDQTAHAAALPPEDANANLMAQLDEKFHEKICESTNNPFLVSLYKQFIPALHTYRLNSFAILKNCSNVVAHLEERHPRGGAQRRNGRAVLRSRGDIRQNFVSSHKNILSEIPRVVNDFVVIQSVDIQFPR